MQVNEDLLYQLVGGRIRRTREQLRPKISQAKLAEKLKVSRASIVNIEAGRQRAPLHLLWQIAEALGTELVLLLPHHDEYVNQGGPVKLDDKTVSQIEAAANGDAATKRALSEFISKARAVSQTKGVE